VCVWESERASEWVSEWRSRELDCLYSVILWALVPKPGVNKSQYFRVDGLLFDGTVPSQTESHQAYPNVTSGDISLAQQAAVQVE
jgi:hypothetical protein